MAAAPAEFVGGGGDYDSGDDDAICDMDKSARGRNRSALSVPSCLVTELQSELSEQPKKMNFLLLLRTLRPGILLLRCLSGLLSNAAKHHWHDTGRHGGRH